MNRFFSLSRHFSCGLLLLASLLAPRLVEASDDPTRPAKPAETAVDPTRMAYIMAWRNSQEAEQHTDAVRVTDALATRIGLSATEPAYVALERFLDNELASNPGRFSPSDDPHKVIAQLLREDVGGFQRVLSPLLSEASYAQYQALLDALRITGR